MINLLPSQEKKELEMEKKGRLTLVLGIILLISFLCLSLILFSIKIYISSKLESQKVLFKIEEERFKASEIQDLREKIVRANQDLSKLDSFYRGRADLTKILEKVSVLLPPGVYLNSFTWQKETLQIGLSGFVSLRDDLFELKKNLEKEKDFSEIYFPASNWVKPKDINFSVTLKVKPR